MRIVLLLDIFDYSGVSRILLNVLKNINKDRFFVTVLLFNKYGELEVEIPKHIKVRHVFRTSPECSTIRIIRLISGFIKGYIPKWLVRRILYKEDYDVVIDYKGVCPIALSAARGKKIYWSHKDFSPVTNLVERNSMERNSNRLTYKVKTKYFFRALKSCDWFISISEKLKANFVERFGYEEKIKVLYNPIDEREIRKLSMANKITIEKNGLRFCCITRFDNGKGIEKLINVVNRLNNENYIFNLLLIGGGRTYENIRACFEKNSIDNIHLLGHLDNPYSLLRDSDVFVCPSEQEAYCSVLAEAIVLNKAIITTDVGSCREMLDNGTLGVIIGLTEDDLFEAMRFFIENPSHVQHYADLLAAKQTIPSLADSIHKIEGFLLSLAT